MRPSPISHVIGALFAVGAFCTGAIAAAPAVDEIFEQGLFAEQTAGDLDAAVRHYAEVAQQTKAPLALAAQAQFRLANCLLKQDRTREARAAFDRLIRDFPEAAELIAEARRHVYPEIKLGPEPWTDGETHVFVMRSVAGTEVGGSVTGIHAQQWEGRPIWSTDHRTLVFVGSRNQSASRVQFEKESMRPLASWWKHSLLGEAATRYEPGRVSTTIVGRSGSRAHDYDETVFDNEESLQLMRRLPLAVGYKVQFDVYAALGGAIVPIELEVAAEEDIDVPAGRFHCYKVVLNVGQTFWFSTDERRLVVKFEIGGVAAELREIAIRHPSEELAWHSESPPGSCMVPADWSVYETMPIADQPGRAAFFLDRDARVRCQLTLRPLAELAEDERSSARRFAEAEAADVADREHQYRPRVESWHESSEGPLARAGYVADLVRAEKPVVSRVEVALGAKAAARFFLTGDAQSVSAASDAFDALVASFREE